MIVPFPTVSRRGVLVFVASCTIFSALALPLAAGRADGEPDRQGVSSVAAGGSFSFQGRLEIDGVPADGLHDFRFTLFDDPTAGTQVGSPVLQELAVANGLFSTLLDFGHDSFNGDARWLLVEARVGVEPYTALGDRQALTATPYALFSLSTAEHTHFNDYFMGASSEWALGVQNDGTGWGFYANSNGLGPIGATIFASNTGGGIGIWNETSTSDTAMVIRNAGSGQLLKGLDAGYNVRFSVASNGFTKARSLSLDGLPSIGPATLDISQPDSARNLIYADVAGATRFTVSAGGSVSAAGQFLANQFDLAEHITTSGVEPGPGDVVEIDPATSEGFRLATTPNSALVAGVISTAPGVVLGSGPIDSPATSPQLALAGRVPVKVTSENGAILLGDMLVSSSTPGHAMKAPANPEPGTVLGKALGAFDSPDPGTITMLIMLR